jgi:putative transposase
VHRAYRFLLRPTGNQVAALTEMPASTMGRCRNVATLTGLRRLDTAMRAFVPAREGQARHLVIPGSPASGTSGTVEFPKDGDGCRWDSTPEGTVARVRFQGVGHVRVHQHRPVKGRVKTISVQRCQRPSYGPRWWPTESPHPSGLFRSFWGVHLLGFVLGACGTTRPR